MISILKGKEPFLVLAGVSSAIAALLHIAIIIGGPAWYRFFGAGEEMVMMAEKGSPIPAIVTFFIALMLSAWALYAFSGAGLMHRLPLIRTVLVVTALIYLGRGIAAIPLYFSTPEAIDNFMIWSSAVSTVFGLSYAIGTGRKWRELGDRRSGVDRRNGIR